MHREGWHTERKHTHITDHTSVFLAASAGCVPVVSFLLLSSLLHFWWWSKRPWSVCYRLSQNTRTNAVLFRGILAPSTSLLKCWWFIPEAVFTPPQVFVCRCRIYPSESSFFTSDLNEALLTPKARRLQCSLPVTSSQVTHNLSFSLSASSVYLPLTFLLFHSDNPQKRWIIHILSFI